MEKVINILEKIVQFTSIKPVIYVVSIICILGLIFDSDVSDKIIYATIYLSNKIGLNKDT